MLLCALFASAMAFPVSIWRNAAVYGDLKEQLEPTSILLIKAPFLNDEKVQNYRIDGILKQFNYDTTQPYLVKSTLDIYENRPNAFTATYKCDKNATFSPPECLSPGGHLVFNFTYAPKKARLRPLGEITYDYAFIPSPSANLNWNEEELNHKRSDKAGYNLVTDQKGQNSLSRCNRFDHELTGGWRLAYYKLTSTNSDALKGFKKGDPIYASSPWTACSTPRPWFQRGAVPIC